MLKITVQYEGSINHYPSYKKIITKTYLFGRLIKEKIETSDAIFIAKSPRRD